MTYNKYVITHFIKNVVSQSPVFKNSVEIISKIIYQELYLKVNYFETGYFT